MRCAASQEDSKARTVSSPSLGTARHVVSREAQLPRPLSSVSDVPVFILNELHIKNTRGTEKVSQGYAPLNSEQITTMQSPLVDAQNPVILQLGRFMNWIRR